MSTTTREATTEVQDQILLALRKGQEVWVEAINAWTEAVERFVPPVPRFPVIDQLPPPKQVVDSTFDFAEQVLAAQRDFAHTVLEATAPLTERITQQAASQADEVQEKARKANKS